MPNALARSMVKLKTHTLFDEIGLASLLETPLTEVAQDPTLMGSTAMKLLLQRIDGDGEVTAAPKEVIFE